MKEVVLAAVLAVIVGAGIGLLSSRGGGAEPLTSAAQTVPTAATTPGSTTTATTPTTASAVPSCREAQARMTKNATVTCRTRTALLTTAPSSRVVTFDGVRLRVRVREVTKAQTESGRLRNRARLVVSLLARPTAKVTDRAPFDAIYLSVAGKRIVPDAAALKEPGAFPATSPLTAGSRRAGELHFELAGQTTTTLLAKGGDVAVRKDDKPTARLGVIRLAPADLAITQP